MSAMPGQWGVDLLQDNRKVVIDPRNQHRDAGKDAPSATFAPGISSATAPTESTS
jgi:hypothetical protein